MLRQITLTYKYGGFESHTIKQNIMHSAVRGGHLHILQWMEERSDYVKKCGCHFVSYAAEKGQLHILKWLKRVSPTDSPDLDGIEHAAKKGHMEVVQCLYEGYDLPDYFYCRVFRLAAERGYLDICKWMKPFVVSDMHYAKYIRDTATRASARGHLHILKWMIREGMCVNNQLIVRVASSCKQYHVVEWMTGRWYL